MNVMKQSVGLFNHDVPFRNIITTNYSYCDTNDIQGDDTS